MNKTYLIDDAAQYVGISRRNFERMNISSREEFREAKDGKNRKVRVYDQAELDRVKAERESSLAKPSLVKTINDDPESQVVTRSDMQDFTRALLGALEQRLLPAAESDRDKKHIDVSSFKDKQILNFAQALAYSGLPEGDLKKALKDKTIKGKKTSKNGTWKIYRISIEEFCRSYFD